jgi:hypothetical protein
MVGRNGTTRYPSMNASVVGFLKFSFTIASNSDLISKIITVRDGDFMLLCILRIKGYQRRS